MRERGTDQTQVLKSVRVSVCACECIIESASKEVRVRRAKKNSL